MTIEVIKNSKSAGHSRCSERKTPLARKSQSPVALCKERIQALARQIVITRDGGCILRGRKDLSPCNGWKNDGQRFTLILQADHLNSRAFSVSYGDSRLLVCVCKGHHGWKHFSDRNKKQYDAIMREILPVERVKLWDAVESNRRIYPMNLSDWQKVEAVLRMELKQLIVGKE